MRKIDLTGSVFGRLTVVAQSVEKGNRGQIKWICECLCGNKTIAVGSSLKDGSTSSCGCLRKECKHNLSHGLSKSRIYRIYRHMINRCKNINVDSFPIYGGRGIKVCEEWRTFEPFYEWAKTNGYKENLSIDRKDNEKGYSPENCQWSTVLEQARNKRNTVCNKDIAKKVIELRNSGVRNKDVSDLLGISRTTVCDIYHGRTWKNN